MIISFKLKGEEEYIQLIQLLKAVGIADSGAMAQNLVMEGNVKVNGEIDYRKRAKIRRGDYVEVFKEKIAIE